MTTTEERTGGGGGSGSSLKDKLKQTMCFSCCFTTRRQSVHSPNDGKLSYSLVKASSTWIKARAHEFPEFKNMCVRLFNRIGNRHGRRHSAANFRYDPLSYSLNFEASRADDEALHSSFCSRLPPSPTLKPLSKKALPLERV